MAENRGTMMAEVTEEGVMEGGVGIGMMTMDMTEMMTEAVDEVVVGADGPVAHLGHAETNT
jgi:hypothetical protein